MANVIKMPLLSDTMEEGVLADVFFKKGDTISSGDILAEVETDKATMEVEAYDEHEGTLLYIASSGDAVPVGGIMAITGEEGEDIEAILAEAKEGGGKNDDSDKEESDEDKDADELDEKDSDDGDSNNEKSGAEKSDKQDSKDKSDSTSSGDDRLKASPLAKRMAEENDLDLNKIVGSGDNGRIVKRDVEDAIESGNAKKGADKAPATASAAAASSFISVAATGEEATEEIKVTQMRKTIAKRLAESKFGAPHFYLTMEINMDKTMMARKEMNELSPSKISFNDLVMKASAMALRQHPDVNSSWQGDKIVINKHIHVGMAVAIDTGLVVPVLRFADNMPLSQMAATSKELAGKARSGELTMDEMQGGTFAVSNLGSMGIEDFTAIINPPNAAILAVGGINKRMREVDGEMKPSNVMKVTLSCDHRVVDGAVGSAFLNTFKKYLQNPTLMVV